MTVKATSKGRQKPKKDTTPKKPKMTETGFKLAKKKNKSTKRNA